MRGDDTYAVEWPLTTESIVLEIGGYEGRWAKQIAERYAPHLYVFEPQQWAYEKCRAALASYPRAQVLNYGLWVHAGLLPMGDYETDGASFVKDGEWCAADRRVMGVGLVREAGEVWRELELDNVDLCLINIEGGEYTLLPHLIETGLLNRIRFLMVQFHLFVPDGAAHYSAARREIERTHRVKWDFGTTLTAWERSA